MFRLRSLLCLLPAVFLGGSVSLAAGEFEIYVNDDAARAGYTMPLWQTGLDLDVGFLHDQDDGDLGHAGVYVAGVAGKGPSAFEVSLGGRLLLAETDVGDGAALGFGGRVAYELTRVERLRFGLSLFYAPESTSFNGVESLLDLAATAGYRVLDNSTVYIAATTARAKFEPIGEVTIDNGLHVGFRARF